MRRLIAAVGWDFRLQWRFGFFLVGAIVAVVTIALLRPFVGEGLGFLIPAWALGNLAVTTFYFAACLVLFEKGEGTLEAILVSPLRPAEYLASKALSLSALATVETLLIVALVYPGELRWLPLGLATFGMSLLYVLIGFVAVARYDSITEFLFPSVFYVTLLQLPILDSLGLWHSPLLYLLPSQAFLLLAKAAVEPVDSGPLVYAALYLTVSVGLCFRLAQRRFLHFLVRSRGVRVP
jgi:fluoroquinolone transport system permease protein